MSRILALGDASVVAADAISGDAHVVVAGTDPGDRVVTVIAGVRTHHVPRIFTVGDNAVVATLATANHCNVVNTKHVGPYCGQVANLTFADDPYMTAGRGAGLYPTR